jgi:hypothetical protein
VDQKKKREIQSQQEKKRPREEGEEEEVSKKKKKKKVGPVPIIPNHILFLENLPSQIYEDAKILDIVFKKYELSLSSLLLVSLGLKRLD